MPYLANLRHADAPSRQYLHDLFNSVQLKDIVKRNKIREVDLTINREFGAYDNIRDNFPKYVVSLDEFDMSRNGIKHRNIRDFLLAEEWN